MGHIVSTTPRQRRNRQEGEAREPKVNVSLRLDPKALVEVDRVVAQGHLGTTRCEVCRRIIGLFIEVKPVPFDRTHFDALRAMMSEVTGAAKRLRAVIDAVDEAHKEEKKEKDSA